MPRNIFCCSALDFLLDQISVAHYDAEVIEDIHLDMSPSEPVFRAG